MPSLTFSTAVGHPLCIRLLLNPLTPPPPTRLSPSLCQQLRPLGLRVDSSVAIGRNLMFERGAMLYPGCSAARLKIGAYSYSSPNSALTTVNIGRYCSIGHAVEFGLGDHKFSGLSASPAILHNSLFMDYSGFIPCYEVTIVKQICKKPWFRDRDFDHSVIRGLVTTGQWFRRCPRSLNA